MAEAVAATGADASLVLVPARFAAAAVIESADAGIALVVCITEGIPLHDEARIVSHLRHHAPGTRLLGPNCPGVITPGRCNIGIIPPEIGLGGGPVGVVSRSGTLTYQALYELTRQGIGQTTCIGIGGDPVPGTGFIDCLRLFEDDPETGAVILIGEIGGSDEEAAAAFIADQMSTPGGRLRGRRDRPSGTARWATPAPSCRARRAGPRPRSRPWRRPAPRWCATPPSWAVAPPRSWAADRAAATAAQNVRLVLSLLMEKPPKAMAAPEQEAQVGAEAEEVGLGQELDEEQGEDGDPGDHVDLAPRDGQVGQLGAGQLGRRRPRRP